MVSVEAHSQPAKGLGLGYRHFDPKGGHVEMQSSIWPRDIDVAALVLNVQRMRC
jgi:hypothetical protein